MVEIPNLGSLNYTYTWFTNNGIIVHNSGDITDTLFNIAGGLVYVAIDPNDGSGGYWGAANVPFPFQVSPVMVPDDCPLQNGSVTLTVSGGFPPYTYSWTKNGIPFGGNTNSLTGISGGLYNCLIVDMNGCQVNLSDLDSSNAGIEVPSLNSIALTMSSTPANCINGTGTVVAAGGNGPYTYLWNTSATTSTITGLSASELYTVTVTDADGCFKKGYLYMTSTVIMNVIANVTNANCTDSDGAATAIVAGGTSPYTYLWNTLATTQTITNIPSGNYSVTVSDAQGCIRTNYVYVSSLSPVNVTYNTTPSQCLGATGTITPVVTGGIPPYTYQWFSNPVQTTPVAGNLAPGLYNYLITDSQGCTNTGLVNIPQSTTLTLSTSSTPTLCLLNNGTATAVAGGGVAPLAYEWGNGQTTPSITGLSSGNMFVTVTDGDGCFREDCVFIDYISSLTMLVVIQDASCIYLSDGGASINIISGVAPYTYQWSNGATTPAVSNLSPGYHYVIVTDANGCIDSQCFYVGYSSVSPCAGTVQGNVFIDLNFNCSMDAGEPGMENIPVKCNTTGDIVFTDATGFYSFDVPPGIVAIEQLPVDYRYPVCSSSNPFTVVMPAAGVIITQDIADTVDWVTDLAVKMYNYDSPPVVGNSFIMRIVEFNRGTIATPSTSEYYYESQAPYVIGNPAPSALDIPLSKATFFNPLTNPLVETQTDVTHYIPVNVPFNTLLTYTDTIFPITGDTTWWDNMDFKQVLTLSSYDPNYKEVNPAGTGLPGFIAPTDSVLQYVIHFQNLGNYFADKVVITDSLDSDLDWNSLRVEYASHRQTASINSSGLLQFTFDNIFLPSVSINEIESNGLVAYTIKLKPGLSQGTEITNFADIYFDFNTPVRTNTTLNTIQITGLDKPEEESFTIYPNPTEGIFTLLFKTTPSDLQLSLFNMAGQEVYKTADLQSNSNQVSVHTKNLPAGVYTLTLITDGSVRNKKLIIQK